MTRFPRPAIAAALLFGAATAGAQTHDVAAYLFSSSPVINQTRVPGSPQPTGRDAQVDVEIPAGPGVSWIYRHDFEHDGKAWRYDGFELIRKTPTDIEFWGSQNATRTEYFVNSPPVKIPRSLALHQAVHYSGDAITESGTFKQHLSFVLVGDKVTRTTPGGRFDNCIRLRVTGSEGPEAFVASLLLAPSAGIVYEVGTDLDETTAEPSVGSEISERVPFQP